MAGVTLSKNGLNDIAMGEQARAIVAWEEENGEWNIDLMMVGKKGWDTILTGKFRNIDRLNELIETAKNLMEVED